MTADYGGIRYEAADGIATITLDRPSMLNAMNAETVAELIDAIRRIDADDQVRVAIVTGEGRGFCSGLQLQSGGLEASVAVRFDDDFRDLGGQIAMAVFGCRKPLIAAVNGPAVGLGATMTLAMDFRLAGATAAFAFLFVRRGLVPEGCASWFLPRLVGMPTALDWMITGRTVDAGEAHDSGLVQRVYSRPGLLPAAYALARIIAAETSPLAVAATRRMLWRMAGASTPEAAFDLESRMGAVFGRSADASEGVQSFLEKRIPFFTSSASTIEQLPWSEPMKS